MGVFIYMYNIYPILIIVLALIFYFCRFDFHLSLQKSVGMHPMLQKIRKLKS